MPARLKRKEFTEYMSKVMKKIEKSSSPDQKSSDEVFGTIVPAELAKLLKILKIRTKKEITIFKMQIMSQNHFYAGGYMPFESLNSHHSDASNSSSNTYNTAAGLTLLGSPSNQSLPRNSTAQTNGKQL